MKGVSEEQVKAEFREWSSMCRIKEDIGTTCSSTSSAIEALNSCPADALPTVHTMLTILATLQSVVLKLKEPSRKLSKR